MDLTVVVHKPNTTIQPMLKVLFVCEKNSARSRIAEAFCTLLGDETKIQVQSAGLNPGGVNPLAAAVMKELGIDISQKHSQDVFELYRQGVLFTHVITVCDEKTSAQCPIFPGAVQREQWNIADIAALQGTEARQLEDARRIREELRARVDVFLSRHQCKAQTRESAQHGM